MLDLNKLEKEIDCFIANQTTESYNELFKSLDEEQIVKLSGGYTVEVDCPNDVVISKPNIMESNNCDFSEPEYSIAA
jgi:hypothetical protein